MTDVVVQLPMRSDAEQELFGDYLSRFMQSRTAEPATFADAEAPYVMVHADPTPGFEKRVVTFQEGRDAHEFSRGWADALRGLTGARPV